jgi:hypothetical protein
MRMNTIAVAAALLLAGLPSASVAKAIGAHAPLATRGVAMPDTLAAAKGVAVPFEVANDTMFIRMAVHGKPLWFILDTGDKYTLVDLQTAKELSLPLGDPVPVGGGGAATVMGNMLKGSEAVLPRARASFPLFLALPLDDLARLSGHEVSGMIGFDLFSRYVVQIDYKAHRILLLDRDGRLDSGKAAVFPITFNSSGHPVIEAHVVDRGRAIPGRFVFDLGSGATVILNRPFVEKAGFLAGGRPSVPWLAGYALGGGVSGRVGRIESLRLGPYALKSPVVIFSQAASGAFAGSEEQGNIGAGVLDRFKVTLDYPHNRIILEPTDRLDDPFDYDKSGLMLTTPGAPYTVFQVQRVADGSPAQRAGIRAGDRLIAVNGRAAGGFTLSSLRMMLQKERNWRLTFDRKGRRVETILRPRPAI